MTEELEKAFAQTAKLSEEEQDALAAWLLEEIASEGRWRQAFAGTADSLQSLADEANREHSAGRTQPLDPNNL